MTDTIYTSFIDGETELLSLSQESGSSVDKEQLVPVISPATNRPVLHFLPSTMEQVEKAMGSAHDKFSSKFEDSWSHPSGAPFRALVLMKIAEELRCHIDHLADLEVRQIGRPKKEMRFQLSRLPEWFEYYASLIRVRQDAITPFTGYLNTVRRVPLGVVVQITPFNHPLLITIKKLAPALAAGNSVVIKPSELAPASIVELAKICTKAGLPPGVLHVILGGRKVGEALVSHPKTAKVDFTGGPQAGHSIGQAAGANLCAYTAELGGKAPMIVFGPKSNDNNIDEYLDPIVNGCAFGAFIASGQTCIAGTRILVEKSIYEAFTEKLVDKTKVFRIGDPEKMETTFGPVITKKQMDFIHETVHSDLASRSQLTLLCGGNQYSGFTGSEAQLNSGNFYEPTVIAANASVLDNGDDAALHLHHSSDMFQKELFGPVVALMPFRDESHAIELANDSKYSLGCSIWTHDLVQAHAVADGVNAGIVWINDHHKNHPSSPWGGLTKESGIGRENGLEAFHEYTQAKSVVMNCQRFDTDWFKDPNARYN